MAIGIPGKDRNGKKNRTLASESEIGLEYPGKLPEESILTLEPAQISLLWTGFPQNRLYYGDNLSILAHLLSDTIIKGKVRLIYIDPPFATNSVFQSRSLSDAYQDLLVGSHYIEFIRQRLIFFRELLADDGSMYVHMDGNMAFHIKVIMDEIFGQKNFRNWITRRKCSHKNYTRKQYGNISDYILFYTKSDHYIWNRPLEEWTDERAKKEYPCLEEETGRRYKKVPVHAPGVRKGATGQPWRGQFPPPGKHWQYPPEQLDEMDARGEIYWSPSGNPRRKLYLENSDGVPIQDIWLDVRDTRNQNVRTTGYPTEKNTDMLSRIIRASSNPGDIVLDGFAGSGTTLEVASGLGRRWIGIDNSKEAIQATLKRFAQGAERMGDFVRAPASQGQEANHILINDFSLYAEHVCMPGDDVLSEWQKYLAILENGAE
jgi:adenine-specific DNA-methyltransferase